MLACLLLSLAVPTEDKDAVLYHPVTEGSVRVTTVTVKGGAATEPQDTTETVTKVDKRDGKYRVTTEQKSDRFKSKGPMTSTVEVSEAGLTRVAFRDAELAQPVVLLKLPAKAGDTWKSDIRTSTVGREEDVEVPAGRFKAVVVVSDIVRDQTAVKTTVWYAPRVGMVKTVTVANGVETTHVLKSFKPGK